MIDELTDDEKVRLVGRLSESLPDDLGSIDALALSSMAARRTTRRRLAAGVAAVCAVLAAASTAFGLVSRGPAGSIPEPSASNRLGATVEVPRIVGLRLGDALARIEESGIVVDPRIVRSDESDNYRVDDSQVWAVDPQPGSLVDGSTVLTLEVGPDAEEPTELLVIKNDRPTPVWLVTSTGNRIRIDGYGRNSFLTRSACNQLPLTVTELDGTTIATFNGRCNGQTWTIPSG